MEPRIQYAKTSDGVNIAYCVMGEGQPLVYASNMWGDIHCYLHNEPTRREVDRLIASGWQVVRYDLRGMGSSDRDVTDFSLAARVKDLEAVVDHAKIDRFALCGYGEGGPVAIAYAVDRPERVSHLFLVNSFAQGSAYYQTVPVMQALAGLRGMAEEQWEFVTLTMATASLGFADPALAKKTAELFRSSTSAKTHFSFLDAAEKVDVLDLLPEVSVPTLVVLDRSGYVTEDFSRVLASSIPSARFVGTNDYPQELHSFVRGEPLAAAGAGGAPSGTAVILFADIVDSTALTERLGDTAFRDKARRLDEAMRAAIRENGGTPVEGKTLGDGVLAVFTSARQAIACAQACHVAASAAGLSLHAGIHAGDVIREADNVYGGAVNIAARVAAASSAGETLVSGTVRDLARTSAGVTFEDRGEQALKGIEEPQRLFAVVASGQAKA
jgi:class 3 adenylate cyclase/pimeloyl-ACP methyl ester carboxylesterase